MSNEWSGVGTGPGEPRATRDYPEVRLDEDGMLDEVVTPLFHLERLDSGHWFLEVAHGPDAVAVWLHGKGKITANYEYRDSGVHSEIAEKHADAMQAEYEAPRSAEQALYRIKAGWTEPVPHWLERVPSSASEKRPAHVKELQDRLWMLAKLYAADAETPTAMREAAVMIGELYDDCTRLHGDKMALIGEKVAQSATAAKFFCDSGHIGEGRCATQCKACADSDRPDDSQTKN